CLGQLRSKGRDLIGVGVDLVDDCGTVGLMGRVEWSVQEISSDQPTWAESWLDLAGGEAKTQSHHLSDFFGNPAVQDRGIRRCTMTIFLVQHGEAKPENEDSERSLTERGTETVERVADWAARMGIKVDEIRHSGKRRAEQTATSFAKRLHPPK